MKSEFISADTSLNNDRRIATFSLRLILAISVFHILWLIMRNWEEFYYKFNHITSLEIGPKIIIPVILLLNFTPYFIARTYYKKGKYRTQIIISTIWFVLFQFLLYILSIIMTAKFY